MREKLRKYSSDILYYSLSFIATLIVWLAHDLDRIGVLKEVDFALELMWCCLLYTSPSPRDGHESRMPSSA